MPTSPNAEIKVLCVDDSPDVAGLLHISISAERGMTSVGHIHESSRVVEEVARSRPNIVVLDLTMPGRDPLEVLSEINAKFPETRTIVYSGYDDLDSVDRAVAAGAWGYVSKHDDFKQVIEAIRKVASGELALTQK